MSEYKYIIVRRGNNELPFIFPSNCVHALMMEAVRAMMVAEVRISFPDLPEKVYDTVRDDIRCVAAGSVRLDIGPTFGGSETIGVMSRPDDQMRMQAFPYDYGYLDD